MASVFLGRSMARWPTVLLAGAFTIGIVACGHGDAAANHASASRDDIAPHNATARVATQRLNPDPCAIVPRAQIEQLIGPLMAEPVRVTSNETQRPDPQGEACVYTMNTPPGALRHFLSLQVGPDAGTVETPAELTPSELKGSMPGVDVQAKANALVDGRWDEMDAGPFGMTVNRGRFAVFMQMGGVDQAKALALAGWIYDTISELPFEAEPDDWPAPSARQNACALLTRADAEAVLGPLVVAPYASQGGSALASAKGWSCAYYTHGHRALVLSPTWSNGKIDFKMASGMEKMIARAAGSGASAATTLDGPWDQVSTGMDGALHILAGDRILVMNYLSSSTDLSGAVTLARIAVKRLNSVPARP